MMAFALHLSEHLWRLQCRRNKKNRGTIQDLFIQAIDICILSSSVAVTGPYAYIGLCKYIL